jgi:hypothetical protein
MNGTTTMMAICSEVPSSALVSRPRYTSSRVKSTGRAANMPGRWWPTMAYTTPASVKPTSEKPAMRRVPSSTSTASAADISTPSSGREVSSVLSCG